MIRNLVRAAAALPLGAFALSALPHDIASAAANPAIEVTLTHDCDGNDWDFMWSLHVQNDGASAVWLKFIDEAGEFHAGNVAAGAQHEMALYGTEGLPASVQVLVDDVVVATDSVPVVDCHTDGTPSASIQLVCPAEGSQDDIAVEYSLEIQDAAAEFEWTTPDGSEESLVVADDTFTAGNKVSEGDLIDVWVRNAADDTVLATLTTTVNCTPDEEPVDEVPVDEPATTEGTPQADQASEGSLPLTGGSTTIAWTALGTTLLGAAALVATQRRANAAGDSAK